MYKKGFSLTELMILMLIVAIALAASMPVITKKHVRLPQLNEHGAYLCYYDSNNLLHEVRYTNKFGMNKAVIDHTTDNCVFNPPKKASYFQISAVGGGGGGGDSGYTGGNISSNWTPVYKISPFNVTEDDLTAKNITLSEFRNYAGTLYAFARGTDSGRGGSANYIEVNNSGTTSPSSSSCKNETTTPNKVCITGPQYENRTEYGCKDTKTGAVTWYSTPVSRDTCISGNNTRFTIVKRTRSVKVANCDCSSGSCYNTPTFVTSENICGEKNNSYTYNWKLANGNSALGPTAGRARKGAYCVSAGISGDIGLTYSKDVTAWAHGADGADLKEGGARSIPTSCSNSTAGSGFVLCSNGTVAQACDKSNATYSEFTISGGSDVSAKAYSAWKAGLGGRRITDNSNTYCNAVDKASSEIATATYSDKFGGLSDTNTTYLSESSTSGDGWCAEGTLVERTYCGSLGSNHEAGYCLKRADDSLAPNGKYNYRYSYDENYLTYGNPGSAGEYKSMVIRSFKDMDTTIRIGRGGIAGTKNSGQSGTSGSATSMGNLIVASGGIGGEGGIPTQNEVLPDYNSSDYSNEVSIYTNCADKNNICTEGNPSYNAATCAQLTNCNTRTYKYIRQAGGQKGLVPIVKELTTNLFNYVIPKIQDSITELFANAGHGGSGGGVVHSCWTGQQIILFEGHYLSGSVYPYGSNFTNPSGTQTSIPSGAVKLPSGCYDNYTLQSATDGTDGALMIKW